MQQRVAGAPTRAARPVFESSFRAAAPSHRVILGVDPSLRGTGYGVIQPRQTASARPSPTARFPAPPNWRALALPGENRRNPARRVRNSTIPTVCVVEGLFYAQNLQTALIMGEARGAALAAIAETGIEIFEIAPRKVKQAIVGYGAAQKSAVAKMVQRLAGPAAAARARRRRRPGPGPGPRAGKFALQPVAAKRI